MSDRAAMHHVSGDASTTAPTESLTKQDLREQFEELLSQMPDDPEIDSAIMVCNVPGEALPDGRKISAYCFLHGSHSSIYTTCYQVANVVWRPGMEPSHLIDEVTKMETIN